MPIGFDVDLFDIGVFDATESIASTPGLPQSRYQVRLYGTDGVLRAIFDDWNSLYYFARLSDFGYHTFSIYGDDPRRDLFTVDSLVEVLKYNDGLGVPWHREYIGFHRTFQDQISDRGGRLFTSYGRGMEDLIHRRALYYPAGSAFDLKSGPADDIMKAYVRENVTSIATVANGRLRDGTIPGFTVTVDIGAGPAYSSSGPWKNVFDIVQGIAKATMVDFDVTVTLPALSFVFSTYWPRKGANRTGANPLVFSTGHANMSQPYGVESHMEEFNTVIVLGPGEATNRTTVLRADAAAQLASPWGAIEHTFDARNTDTVSALQAVGDEQLRTGRATRKISFTALQSRSTIFGRDFFLGDLVVARYKSLEAFKKLIGVEVTMAEGKENIRFHFDDE